MTYVLPQVAIRLAVDKALKLAIRSIYTELANC